LSERSEFAVFSLLRMSESDSFRKHEAGQAPPLGPRAILSLSIEDGKNPLIIVSYIKKQMDDKGLFKKYTIQGVLDVIECFQQPGSRTFLGEVTSKQKQLFEDLGVESILL